MFVAAAILGAAWRRLFRECALYAPPALQSPANRCLVHTKTPRPSGDAQCLAVESQEPVVASVVLLFFHCRPATIARLVAPGAVDPVNCVPSRGPFAHVGEEVLERAPSLTNGNPDAAVSSVIVDANSRASRVHCEPRLIGIAAVVPVGFVSCCRARGRPLSVEAAT